MKDFDKWNEIKKKINQKYLRPALVLLSFGKGGGIVLPLTTSNKNSKFLFKITKKSSVNLSQVRYFDSRRFYKKMGYLNKVKFNKIITLFVKLFVFIRK